MFNEANPNQIRDKLKTNSELTRYQRITGLRRIRNRNRTCLVQGSAIRISVFHPFANDSRTLCESGIRPSSATDKSAWKSFDAP